MSESTMPPAEKPFIAISEKGLRPGERVAPLVRYRHLQPLQAARSEVSFWKEKGFLPDLTKNPRLLTEEECVPLQRDARARARISGQVFPEPNGPQAGELIKSQGVRDVIQKLKSDFVNSVSDVDGIPPMNEQLRKELAAAFNMPGNAASDVDGLSEEDFSGDEGEGNRKPQDSPGQGLPKPPKRKPVKEMEEKPVGSGDDDENENDEEQDYVTHPELDEHVKWDEECHGAINTKADLLAEAVAQIVPRLKKLEDDKTFPTPVVVKFGDKAALPDHDAGLQHYLFPVLLTIIQAGVNAYLPGPAGAGKTRGCREAAKALGLDFRLVSVCEETSASALMGYMDAQGRYVRSALRECFEHGGVFLLDEMDAGNANTLTVINAITSTEVGETASFPDGMVKRHENFRFVAAGNTFGTGASFHYVGRNRLDAATLDRMAYLAWPVDKSLEAALVGVAKPRKNPDLGFGGKPSAALWLGLVDLCREAANKHDMKLILSPRCVMMGCRLAAAGLGMAWLKELLIFKDLPDSSQELLQEALERAANPQAI